MGENTALSGMKEIQEFCRSINLPSSESTVMNAIMTEGFPARKLGGIWESDKELIAQWRKERLIDPENGSAAADAKPEKKKDGKKKK